MKRYQDNTSLWRLADGKNAGVWLSLCKGLNELVHLCPQRPHKAEPLPKKEYARGKISVILCTYRRPMAALTALNSLLQQTLSFDQFEILVVDNAPGDREFRRDIEVLWRQSGAFIGYLEEPRTGISYARNTGAMRAAGEYLLFLDDDAVADRFLLAAIQNAFKRHTGAGVIGGQILLDIPEPKPDIFEEGSEHLWSGYTVSGRGYRTVKQAYAFPYGACFGVRHDAFDAAGGFCTKYGRCGEDYAGGEETAFCFSVMECGYTVGIQPSAQVTHRVEAERFSEEHVRQTVRAGLKTTAQLSADGYIKTRWTDRYLKTRIKIAERELKRLHRKGASRPTVFRKECERDVLVEMLEA